MADDKKLSELTTLPSALEDTDLLYVVRPSEGESGSHKMPASELPANDGDVVGPASAVDGHIAAFDGTTGKLIKDGGVLGTAAHSATGDFDPAGAAAAAQAASLPLHGTADDVNPAGTGIAAALAAKQALAANLTAIAALVSAANKLIRFTGSGTADQLDFSTSTTLSENSDTTIASQKAVKAYVDALVTGLLDFKGSTDCSGNPNYPAASKGDAYYVSVAGKIGGASGKSVEIGDLYVASADNAGGTEASVGTSWFVLEHNLVGAAVTSGTLAQFAATTSAELRGVLSDETGTGAAYFQGGDLGTPSAGVGTNLTGIPLAGVTGAAFSLAVNLYPVYGVM